MRWSWLSGIRGRLILATALAAVAGSAAWASVADGKAGWTAITAVLAAVIGAFGPSFVEWQRGRMVHRSRQVSGALVADLPSSVAWLLHPQKAVVGFFGRGWVLQELETWCADPGAAAVRLLVGAGGVGKTRLAAQLKLRLKGWETWTVAPGGEEQVAAALTPKRLLLVVDYAEARAAGDLALLMCSAQRAPGVRILMLARSAGLWWSSLSASYPQQAHLVDALTVSANVVELPARIEERAPREIVLDAVQAFADHLRRKPPEGFEPRAHDGEIPVLRLHAEALVAVLGGTGDERHDVLAEVLSHEVRYWRHCARQAGMIGVDPLLRQVVGLAALLGTSDDVVRRAPLIAEAEADKVADWLRGLYPDGATLQPDLLAETLAVQVLQECTSSVFTGLTLEQAQHALTVLGRADASEMIDVALAADVQLMTEAILTVGLQFPGVFAPRIVRILESAPIDLEWARRVARKVPYPSLELGKVALALTSRIVAKLDTTSPQDNATWMLRHAVWLAEAGRRVEALEASQEAVGLYRELVAGDRDGYLPDLARSMNNYAVRLAEMGRRVQALEASQEAVGLRRELVAGDRDGYLPNLARSMNNHAVRLAEAGRRVEALEASQEAVGLRRELVAGNRDAYLPDLAMSVGNYAVRLAEVGRRVEALEASQEAVGLWRELVAENRDAYLPDLAMSVNNYAVRLAEAGREEEALEVSREAVALRRELAAGNRVAYLPDLARSVSNHAVRLAEVGWRAEALEASREAAELWQELAVGNRNAYLPDLAESLWNMGYVALLVGEVTKQAVDLTAEGVEYFDELAATEPEAFAEQRDAAAETLVSLRQRLLEAHGEVG